MAVDRHLAGIASALVATRRIRSHVLSIGPRDGIPVVLLHGNLTSATCYEELMVAMPRRYRCIAPDLRGYGDTEDLVIDATRGVLDLVDDLEALMDELDVESAHIAGWSAGAAVATEFMIGHAHRVRSLTLIAPVSPYGFGGTCDNDGTPCHPDYAGSGGGTVNADFMELLRKKDRTDDLPMAPLGLIREFFVHPPTRLGRENALLEAMFKQKLGEDRYPGDYDESGNFPNVAPGRRGPLNTLSPKYFNTSRMAGLPVKPPVLWIRGAEDRIVSDRSLFDPNVEQDPQPMVSQTAAVLDRYEADNGVVRRETFEGVGHTPFLEDAPRFLETFCGFLADVQDG